MAYLQKYGETCCKFSGNRLLMAMEIKYWESIRLLGEPFGRRGSATGLKGKR
jgi:hypothetical protein